MLASMTFMGVVFGSLAMFIMFGPRNPIIGFTVGAATIAVFAAACFRFPVLLSFASVREREEERAIARFASILTKAAIENSDDLRRDGHRLARLMGWVWTIIVGGLAILMAVMVVGMIVQGKEFAETTDAATLCGFFSAVAAITWKYLARLSLT